MLSKKKKIILLIGILFILLCTYYLVFGVNLLNSSNSRIKRLGLFALNLRIDLCLYDVDTLIYVMDASCKDSNEDTEVFKATGNAYYKLSTGQKELFNKKMGQLFLDKPHWPYPAQIYFFYKLYLNNDDSNQIKTDIFVLGIDSENYDQRDYSWFFIMDKFKQQNISERELEMLCQKAFEKSFQKKEDAKISNILFVVYNCKLINFIETNKKDFLFLSQSSKSQKIKMFAKGCLELLEKKNQNLPVP